VRDLHLRHTLTALARDASGVFSDIVESGQEIPYEIGEPGDAFAFCQYRPLTARFVRDNATELRELDSFREATETMRRTEIAGTYLDEAGIAPPGDGHERATLAVTYFLARLWDGCSSFEIDEERFKAALEEIESCSEPEAGEVEAIVPLIGLTMPVGRLDIKGAAIVRGDTVEVPPEAARPERGGNDWQPSFLISARVPLDEEGGLGAAGDRVARTFERVVTTLRLFKRGGVALGPHGWVRVAGDRWRRIATGSARPRPGGYRLEEDELDDLVALARTVAVHPKRVKRFRRALLRFETGLDRRAAIDALNDHLLSLRFMLEGEGPAGVGLPMRAAALATDTPERGDTKRLVEDAVALERGLWSGEPVDTAGSPGEIALGLEELLRTILRRAVAGELGNDLRSAADETLLADGLAIGAGAEQGGTSEWELADGAEQIESETEPFDEEPATREEPVAEQVEEAFERFERDPEPEIRASRPRREPVSPPGQPELPVEEAEGHSDSIEPPPEREPTRATQPLAASTRRPPALDRHEARPEAEPEMRREAESEPVAKAADEPPVWLAEVGGGGETMDFPARSNHLGELSRPPMDREEVKARVDYLFPRTETDWTVGRKAPRRAAAG
jgi:hypothetical protein